MAGCPATTQPGLPCMEGFTVRCERPAAKHRKHWTTVRCLSSHGPHCVEWRYGADLCPWCGGYPWAHRGHCPDAPKP